MSLDDVVAFVMAGGRGSRLKVLTRDRTKPAVAMLGVYRIFDFAATNVSNSDIDTMIVATQFLPRSLNDHIRNGDQWGFDHLDKNLEIFQPYRNFEGETITFEGTADSVRKSTDRIDTRYNNTDLALILGGDHVYSADYREVIDYHKSKDPEITLMTTIIPEEKVPDFGIVKIDDSGRIIDFAEKTSDPEIIEEFRLTERTKQRMGIENPNLNFLGSMGNYAAEWDKLKYFLKTYPGTDFGNHIIPGVREDGGEIYASIFEGYWRDVGKVNDFYNTNLEFVNNKHLDNIKNATKTTKRDLPAAWIQGGASVNGAILSPGDEIYRDSSIRNSVLGYQVVVEGANIRDSILLGADRNQHKDGKLREEHITRIGKGSSIDKTIMDKNVWIGKNVILSPEYGSPEERISNLESIGLKHYDDSNPETHKNADFYIESENNILVLGKQLNTSKPMIPDNFEG